MECEPHSHVTLPENYEVLAPELRRYPDWQVSPQWYTFDNVCIPIHERHSRLLMSTKTPFREGDRVVAKYSKPPIKAGMVGTIQRVFRTVIDLYDVQFDDLPHPYISRGYQLALQEDEPPARIDID